MERTIVAFFMTRNEARAAVEFLQKQGLISEAHLMENMDMEAQLSNRLWDSQESVGEAGDQTGGINLVVRTSRTAADQTSTALLDHGARRAEIY